MEFNDNRLANASRKCMENYFENKTSIDAIKMQTKLAIKPRFFNVSQGQHRSEMLHHYYFVFLYF